VRLIRHPAAALQGRGRGVVGGGEDGSSCRLKKGEKASDSPGMRLIRSPTANADGNADSAGG
jgi:hypothetical protein